MPSPDSKTRARAELVDLLESQLNTLEKESLGCVTELTDAVAPVLVFAEFCLKC
jgi:hypothetical protein